MHDVEADADADADADANANAAGWCRRAGDEQAWWDVLVVKGAARGRRSVLAGARLALGNDGLQLAGFPPLLRAIAVGGLRNLLGLVDGRLLDVGAVHGLEMSAPPWAAAGTTTGTIRRSGRVGQRSWTRDKGRRPQTRGSNGAAIEAASRW